MSKRDARALARAGEAQEPLDGAVEAVALLEQDLDQLALRGIAVDAAGEHLHRARDRRQRVADLVRQARRELAHRDHAVLHPQLLLDAPPAGEVLEDDDVAAVVADGVGRAARWRSRRSAVAVAAGQLDLGAHAPRLLAGGGRLAPAARR